MSDYYLVQRMTKKDQPYKNDKGIDSHFDLDYMGSSEFEWGAVPKSLKRLRQSPVEVTPQPLSFEGQVHTVYFVAHPNETADKWAALQRWVDGGMRGKEWTKFDRMLRDAATDWRTDAWWSIDTDAAWALDQETADLLATAINTKPAL